MKRKTFLAQTGFPLRLWKKQRFIGRLSARFSGLKELREYWEDEYFGITHIFIRVGLSIEGHLLVGMFTMGIGNLVVETNAGRSQSIHKYFDTQTGIFLGHSRKDAVERLFQIGNTFCKDEDFSKAREYFNNAYRNSEDDHQGRFFREMRDQVDKVLKEHRLKEQIKIQDHEAGDSPAKVTQNIYLAKKASLNEDSIQECKNLKKTVSINDKDKSLAPPATTLNSPINSSEVERFKQLVVPAKDSEILYEQDVINFQQEKLPPAKDIFPQTAQAGSKGAPKQQKRQFITARTCFDNALQKCSSSYKSRERFQKMKALAENCIKQDEANKKQNETAEECYRLGMGHMWRDEVANAKTCFEDAYLKCTSDYVNKTLFYEKQLDAESGIRKQEQQKWQNRAADELFNQGVSRLQGDDFAGASLCFIRAYHRCSQNYGRKQSFLLQCHEAEREVEKRSREIRWGQKT
ncbi:unnamed protein product [Allacma fusca]|uniref:Uncharacterized protein n=1 Tax=Allacma fusca TaxID=39272 RepID=A0A8J2K5Q6_9HEXA|nr:unnamed protein product [Allacma fusca]